MVCDDRVKLGWIVANIDDTAAPDFFLETVLKTKIYTR